MSRQPLFLDRDGLRDSVVEIYFETPYNVNHIAQAIMSAEGMSDLTKVGNPADNSSIFLLNSLYRIQVRPDCISFNSVKSYQRWINYAPFIKSVIGIVLSKELVSINRQMIRYISVFPNVSVFDNLNGEKMQLKAFPSIDGTEIRFTMKITDGHSLGIATIRLTDNMISPKKKEKESVVDLQIITQTNNLSVIDSLEFLHTQERNLFFSILDKRFIDSLGAHYE